MTFIGCHFSLRSEIFFMCYKYQIIIAMVLEWYEMHSQEIGRGLFRRICRRTEGHPLPFFQKIVVNSSGFSVGHLKNECRIIKCQYIESCN